MGLMYCNVLAFIFNKPLPERPLPNWTRHASQLKSMASRSPENFFILADTSIIHSSTPPLRQMPIGFYRQVALDFPACFDFYGKFLGLTFITSFLPKFLNILLDPPPGAGTLYSIPAGWIEIFLQSSKRTNSDKADIALNDLLLVLTNQKSNSSN